MSLPMTAIDRYRAMVKEMDRLRDEMYPIWHSLTTEDVAIIEREGLAEHYQVADDETLRAALAGMEGSIARHQMLNDAIRELVALRAENAQGCRMLVAAIEINDAAIATADAEAVRWQDRIADVIRRAGLVPHDASGNESGDPLDWTADQVEHAIEDARTMDKP